MQKKTTSPWVWIGCGCGALIVLLLVALAAATYFGVGAVKDFAADMNDPEARNARAAEILGTDRLPPGYHAKLFFRLPLVMEMVVLSDGVQAADPEDEPWDNEHTFVAMSMRRQRAEKEAELERFLSGEPIPGLPRAAQGLYLDSTEQIGEGRFEVGEQSFVYEAHRGELIYQRQRFAGSFATLRIDCPEDDRLRMAVWFRRHEGDGELPAGGPTDEGALRRFLAPLDFCGG